MEQRPFLEADSGSAG